MTAPHKMIAGDPNVVVPALRGLRTGQNIVYHTGFLASDRCRKHNDPRLDVIAQNINFIARTAMELSDANLVHLTQRKLGMDAGYEYIATGA